MKDIKEQAQDMLNATHVKKDDYKDLLDKAMRDIIKEAIASRVSADYLEKLVKERIEYEVRYNLSRELNDKIKAIANELASKIEISFKN